MSAARTIVTMDEGRAGRRDLALVAVTVVGLSRLIEPPGVWLVAIFLLGAIVLGTLQVLGDEAERGERSGLGIPIESLFLPAVAAVACLGAIRLVPFGLGLAPALLVTGWLVASLPHAGGADPRRAGRVRRRWPDRRPGHDAPRRVHRVRRRRGHGPRWARPARAPVAWPADRCRDATCSRWPTGDAVIAFLLGYRAVALRVSTLRDALWSAGTYAAAIAIAAATVRAMEIPRLMGPALLTLTFYLWDAFHAATPTRRREARWIWQTILLALLGAVVIACNLLIRT